MASVYTDVGRSRHERLDVSHGTACTVRQSNGSRPNLMGTAVAGSELSTNRHLQQHKTVSPLFIRELLSNAAPPSKQIDQAVH